LITGARKLEEIRGSATWKKVLETEDLADQVKEVVQDIDEEMKIFSVSGHPATLRDRPTPR